MGAMQMREGNLFHNIFLYSLPLMLTNLLQVFFNLADVAVVGQFAGSIALGAVGSTVLLISMTTGWLMGMSGGVNSLAALFLGAEDHKKLKQCVDTGFFLCLGVGVLVAAAGNALAVPVLRLLGTKEELIGDAVTYFRIYCLGGPALGLYNYGNAVLSAAGDTRRPLIYLSIAGVLNVGLNLFFVIVLHMGCAGVALASIISQYLSMALILRYLVTVGAPFRLGLRTPAVERGMAGRILSISVPTALQYSLFAIANLFVQSAVNSFDHVTVEGNSAAANADSLVYDMMAAFYTACTSFIGQNLGAGKLDRVRKTYFVTTLYSFGIGLVMGLLLYVFRRPFLGIFTTDAEVVERGLARIGVMSHSYCISAFMDNATAAARGLGKTVVPTVIVVIGTVVYRIIWIYTVFTVYHTLQGLYLLYPTAWTLTAIFGNLYFFREYRRLRKDARVLSPKS